MVDTEPKFEWRFVCYHEHEYYGILVKISWSKYSYMMIVSGEDKPSKAFNLPIDSTTFNEMVAYRGCLTKPKEDKPYYRKLAVYIMCRAGIITKQTRDKLLSLYKEKSAMNQRAREQAKLNKIHKCYLKFMNDLGGMVTPQEKRELWESSGVHAYLVKKFGIEKVCNCCVGGER